MPALEGPIQTRRISMTRSLMYGLALVFLFASASRAQAPPIGAVIQTQHYDPSTNHVTLTIANVSHKDITAFNIAIKETYADGHVSEHELLEELVGKILAAKELQGDHSREAESFRKLYGDGGFHPGEVHNEQIPVDSELTRFEAVIDVVTYADGTADSTNKDGLQRIVDERQATIASKKMATEIIKAALADPNDSEPQMTAAKKIQDQATTWRRSHTKMDLEPVVLESIANEVKTVSSPNKRDGLKQLVDREEAQISMLSIHAAVVKNGGPQ
jgi:hypothetical protein